MPRGKKSSVRAKNHNRKNPRVDDIAADLEEFERFRAEILQQLRADLDAGLSAHEIYNKYANLAAARGITIALSDTDSGKALAAVKEILDRSQGKPTEKKEVKHQFEELPDEELDAVLQSELQDLKTLEEKRKH